MPVPVTLPSVTEVGTASAGGRLVPPSVMVIVAAVLAVPLLGVTLAMVGGVGAPPPPPPPPVPAAVVE